MDNQLRMKIALVGPGIIPIPPPGWGAVEILIWDYYTELTKKGHDVTIVNTKDLYEIINTVNQGGFDFVHIHYDQFYKIIPFLKCSRIALTSHYPYIDKKEHHGLDGYNKVFQYMLDQHSIYNFVLAEKDLKILLESGANPTYLKKIKNGINSELFHFILTEYNDRTMYLGKITSRKNQHLFQDFENIDFVGMCDNAEFDTNRPNYLGQWTREEIHQNLTKYSNLLLISQGEADPLVVKEALIAGLGVVINKSSAENLDVTQAFITVIEDEKISDLEYIRVKLEENRQIAITCRQRIREYGISQFDISKEVDNYLDIIYKL